MKHFKNNKKANTFISKMNLSSQNAKNEENIQINMQNLNYNPIKLNQNLPNNQIQILEIKNAQNQNNKNNKNILGQIGNGGEAYFPITINQIDKVFENYMKGNRELEVEELQSLGRVEGILKRLKTNPITGLTGQEQENKYIKPSDEFHRINEFLDNVKIETPLQTCCQHAWEALKDLMIRLIILAAIVQIILGTIPQISEDSSKEWVRGFSIIVAVAILVSEGSITNWSKEKAFKELNKKSKDN